MRDTIFALSSGSVPSGVAIIRISGSAVRFGLETLIGKVPTPRYATFTDITDESGILLDRGLVLYFPSPNSFTGEDVAEFQIHGSRATIDAVLTALGRLEGYRLAEPGEFTRQAFENGRMDLTEVEGLSDLIRAQTESQRRQALFQAEGGLRHLYESWAARLTHARAMIEAELDFADEEDVPGSVSQHIWADMDALSKEMAEHLSKATAAEVVRDGYRVALVGAPNVGKSSLLNYLANRDVAIVSDIPGTTRDVVEVQLDINGQLVRLMDTAGIRETENEIEAEGIRRSHQSAMDADLILELKDISENHDDTALIIDTNESQKQKLTIWTKLDTVPESQDFESPLDLAVSTVTGAGMDVLIDRISECINFGDRQNGPVLPTRQRHVELVQSARFEIEQALSMNSNFLEIRSECLRRASDSLGRITGMVDVEDLLDVVFSEFCVGK